MIIRLMGEGQWQVADSLVTQLNELDQTTESAVAAGDEPGLHAALQAMSAAVKEAGEQLGDDYLGASDLVIPPTDLTLAEARELLHGEGLIPDIL